MKTIYKKKIKNIGLVQYQLLKKITFLKVGQFVEITIAIIHNNKIKKYKFSGRCLAYRKCGLHSFVTLRNTFKKVGVELSVLIYSPTLININILKKTLRPIKKSKLYYLQYKPAAYSAI